MSKKVYIRINETNNDFGFIPDDIYEPLPTDVEIPEEFYLRALQAPCRGKQLTLIDVCGKTYDEMFNEVDSPQDTTVYPPSNDDRLAALEAALMGVL